MRSHDALTGARLTGGRRGVSARLRVGAAAPHAEPDRSHRARCEKRPSLHDQVCLVMPSRDGKEIEPGGIGAAVAPGDLDVDDVRAAGRPRLEAALERGAQLRRILDALRLDAVALAIAA